MGADRGQAGGRGVERLLRLLETGRALTSSQDLLSVLDGIVVAARDLTHARHAALEVLDGDRLGVAQVLTVGVEDPTRAAGFLGVPITVRGQVLANLNLTDKQGAEDFDGDDHDTVRALAEWAAMAIDNARLSGEATAQRHVLKRALLAQRTAMEIATAVGTDTDLPRILELIATLGRTLVEADALLIWLRNGDELRIAAVAGNATVPVDATMSLRSSTAGEALATAHAMRVDDMRSMGVDPVRYGITDAGSALVVPMIHRGRGHGVLMAFDRLGASASFDDEDQRAMEAFAASAATAVATARSVEAQRLHDTMAAAESERRRWSRELHDETLQGLASLKLILAAALRAEASPARAMLASAAAQLDEDIASLRTIIADLRPAALDELGLEPALRTLVRRVCDHANLKCNVSIDLGQVRLEPDIETIAYRIAQEALTNVVKHADASAVSIELWLQSGGLRLVVNDDGHGMGSEQGEGYGIIGMRERAALASGTLDVTLLPDGGTRVTLALPPGGEIALMRRDDS